MLEYKQVYTTDELVEIIDTQFDKLVPTRKITHVHCHHTWKPNDTIYKNLLNKYGSHENVLGVLQNSMARSHKSRKFDYAGRTSWGKTYFGVHVTMGLWSEDANSILWCIGRDWNSIPCSISGSNTTGFAIEQIGNFDTGEDIYTTEKRMAFTRVWEAVSRAINRDPKDTLLLHREKSSWKSCPGNTVTRELLINSLDEIGMIDIEFSNGTIVKDVDRSTVNALNVCRLFTQDWKEYKPKQTIKVPNVLFGGNILCWKKNPRYHKTYISNGAHVKSLQEILNTLNEKYGIDKLSVDGSFGPSCDKALRLFQRKEFGYSGADGICGPGTRTRLRERFIEELSK